MSPELVGREMWQGRFGQSHTPADPCSQLLLPCGCAAPLGHADLALNLLGPGEPHPAAVTSSLFWSERFLQEGARAGCHSVTPSVPGSSLGCLLTAARGLWEAATQNPGALYPHGTLARGTQRQCPGKCSGDAESCSVVSRGRWDAGERSQGSGSGSWWPF